MYPARVWGWGWEHASWDVPCSSVLHAVMPDCAELVDEESTVAYAVERRLKPF
ncbi:hypothetical protein CBOM_04971 [Ceraceosorus bombacis]|uniref:Uncharacterized protein n=1 Tax=Ceraceosorus bombacis TaxID=401625 RepID=A0A0P1BHF5_9BASI|nr:hypothetical protein CBOM_04971 [Ceraceosorus bombacis]